MQAYDYFVFYDDKKPLKLMVLFLLLVTIADSGCNLYSESLRHDAIDSGSHSRLKGTNRTGSTVDSGRRLSETNVDLLLYP